MGDLAVPDLGHQPQVAAAVGLLGFKFEVFNLLLAGLDMFGKLFFGLPLRTQLVALVTEVGDLFAEAFEPVCIVFAFDGFAFNLQLPYFSLDDLEFLGQGVDLKPEFGGGFVHEVDGLVGEEAFTDIPL